MDSLMRTALAAQDMFPVIRLIEELETALTQSQADLAEAREEIEKLRAAIDHDVVTDVNHFDPRTTHE